MASSTVKEVAEVVKVYPGDEPLRAMENHTVELAKANRAYTVAFDEQQKLLRDNDYHASAIERNSRQLKAIASTIKELREKIQQLLGEVRNAAD